MSSSNFSSEEPLRSREEASIALQENSANTDSPLLIEISIPLLLRQVDSFEFLVSSP